MSVKVEFRKDRRKYQVTYLLNGQRRRPLFNSKALADNFARKISLGLAPEDKLSIGIDEAAKKYFEAASSKKSPKSAVNDKRYLNLLFHFMTVERGIEYLPSIQLDDMEAFRDWLPVQAKYDNRRMRMGPSSVNRCLRVLKHFFKRHVQWKSLTESPCVYLEYLETEENERRPMTKAEYEAMLAKVPDWYIPVLQFIYLTGAPPSCVERLVFADLDFSNRRFFMRRKKGTKAKWKKIPLPMTDEVFALLIKRRNGSAGIDDYVFKDGAGRRLLADRISRVGNRAIRDAGVKGVTLYCLRHALATDLTEANVATELVRQAMGHSSVSTTQRYSNKARSSTVAGALELVRGGSLVANEKI